MGEVSGTTQPLFGVRPFTAMELPFLESIILVHTLRRKAYSVTFLISTNHHTVNIILTCWIISMDKQPTSPLHVKRGILERWINTCGELEEAVEFLREVSEASWSRSTVLEKVKRLSFEHATDAEHKAIGIEHDETGWRSDDPLLNTSYSAWSHLRGPGSETEDRPTVEWLWPLFSCAFL
jgi:hypothetical protein